MTDIEKLNLTVGDLENRLKLLSEMLGLDHELLNVAQNELRLFLPKARKAGRILPDHYRLAAKAAQETHDDES